MAMCLCRGVRVFDVADMRDRSVGDCEGNGWGC